MNPLDPQQGSEETAGRSQRSATSFLKKSSGFSRSWKAGAVAAGKKFFYVAVPTALWAVLLKMDLLPTAIAEAGTLLLTVCLFLLAMPTGLVLRIDDLASWGEGQFNKPTVLLIVLLVVGLNFILVGAVLGVLRKSGKGQQ